MPAQPATPKQLNYLKALAVQRGQSFTYPKTTQQASREINRLKRTHPDSHADQRRERKQIADAIQAGPANTAARIRDDEITGHGSSATWTHHREPQAPAAPASAPATTRSRPVTGERTELGSYQAGGERRLIIGQRVDGIVRVTDIPASGRGRRYLIDRELESHAELQALVADYLTRAGQLGAVPTTVMPVETRA